MGFRIPWAFFNSFSTFSLLCLKKTYGDPDRWLPYLNPGSRGNSESEVIRVGSEKNRSCEQDTKGQHCENRKMHTLRAQGKRPQKLCFLPQTKSPVRGYSNCSQSTQAVVFCGATRVDEDRKHYRALGKAVKTMMDTHTDTAYLS